MKGGLIKMVNHEPRFNCVNCGINVSEKKMQENKLICPVCGKDPRWFLDLADTAYMFRLEED